MLIYSSCSKDVHLHSWQIRLELFIAPKSAIDVAEEIVIPEVANVSESFRSTACLFHEGRVTAFKCSPSVLLAMCERLTPFGPQLITHAIIFRFEPQDTEHSLGEFLEKLHRLYIYGGKYFSNSWFCGWIHLVEALQIPAIAAKAQEIVNRVAESNSINSNPSIAFKWLSLGQLPPRSWNQEQLKQAHFDFLLGLSKQQLKPYFKPSNRKVLGEMFGRDDFCRMLAMRFGHPFNTCKCSTTQEYPGLVLVN